MDNRDAGIPREIPVIQRERLSDAVRQHRRDKPRIVRLDSCHRVSDYKPAPFGVNPLVIR
ncbi:MAG: hypothetical protein FJW34_10350 [Acidobacteria bacterium]|nr:hypothetical protein [Acidobacteriota bacterium]